MAIVLLLDRDPLQTRVIGHNLESLGHHVLCAQQEWEGLVAINRVHPDLVVLDCSLPRWRELLRLLRKLQGCQTTPLLLIAPHCPPRYYLRKFTVGAWLHRHFAAEELVCAVQTLLLPTPYAYDGMRYRNAERKDRGCSSACGDPGRGTTLS
ncbi:response regulator [Kallotenue papyrolyticum]|uniref:response regulator n=1 Tax=Kallotenue papyrolyticum TaxID=1325125 RepID=UPI0004785E1D|nr:response regulator [Kallotenue papyrolyticum]